MGATGAAVALLSIQHLCLSDACMNQTSAGLGRPTMDSLSHDVSMHVWRMSTTDSSDHPRNSTQKNATTISLADPPTSSAPEAHR